MPDNSVRYFFEAVTRADELNLNNIITIDKSNQKFETYREDGDDNLYCRLSDAKIWKENKYKKI